MANARRDPSQALVLAVCGDRWDLEKTDPRDLLSHVMVAVLSQWSPLESLKRSSRDLISLLSEIQSESSSLTEKSRRLWRSYCTRMRGRLERIASANDRGQAISLIYDCLLSLEGLGTLGGFSAQGGIHLGTMNYNPEKKSIMRRY